MQTARTFSLELPVALPRAGGENGSAPHDWLARSVEREVRTPLATLMAAADMLAAELGPDHAGSGFARLIRQQSARIQETLSEFAALTAPLTLAFRPVAVVPLLEELASAETTAPHPVRIELERPADAPLSAWGDAGALRLAMEKIIRHEIAAMPYGGVLRIAASRAEGGDAVLIRFEDNGPRVGDEQLTALFEPFVAAAGRRPGMHLALARRIIEHLGGSVAARGTPQGGLLIEARLPSRARPLTPSGAQ